MAYNQELAGRMRAELKSRRGIVEKSMFGGIGFMVNGNMACGVLKDEMVVRLDEAAYQAALKKKGVRQFEIGGRRSNNGWILVGPAGWRTEAALRGWMEQGVEFARSLPKK
jgi:TfoX/Sxy family transcriptional regulator of competence genes